MKRTDKNAVADRFNKLDFHDDGLTGLAIHPPRGRNNFTRIDFELRDDSTGSVKVLSFHSCANFRFVVDFDVLADNWYGGNTESSVAKTDVARMRKLVRAHMSHWRTTYMPPMPKDKPVRKKLASLRNFILFRVAFFGGTAEILAKNYRLER
jgi:hypothetical protein